MEYNYDIVNSSLDIQATTNGTVDILNGTLQFLIPQTPPLEKEGPDLELASLKVQLKHTRFVVQRILVPIVVLVGVAGNILNMVVLTRRWMRSSTNYYLSALALCDILYLSFAFTLSFFHYEGIKTENWYIRYQKPFGGPIVDIFSNTGVWLTLTFTIERYIGVCHPMKGKRWCTPQRARYIIVIVCACATVITFPEFFQYNVTSSEVNNKTVVVVTAANFSQSVSYQFGYMYMNQALFTIIPLLLLLLFNSLLINAVLHAAKQRREMSQLTVVRNERHERHSREQQKITIMLISVVIVFLVCQLPQAIANLYISYLKATVDPSTGFDPKVMTRLIINNNVCNLLVMINASINFVLYSSFSTKFRGTFKRLFCRCLRSKDMNHLFSEFVSMSGHGNHPAEKKYSVSYSTGRTSVSVSSHCGAKPLLRNGNASTDSLLKREYLKPMIKVSPSPKKKNGYLAVKQDMDVDSVVSSL